MPGAREAAFRVARTGRGKPLLLLHGRPGLRLSRQPAMTRLADRCTLLAPDLRGFGDSDKPGRPFGAAGQESCSVACPQGSFALAALPCF